MVRLRVLFVLLNNIIIRLPSEEHTALSEEGDSHFHDLRTHAGFITLSIVIPDHLDPKPRPIPAWRMHARDIKVSQHPNVLPVNESMRPRRPATIISIVANHVLHSLLRWGGTIPPLIERKRIRVLLHD